MNNDFTPRPAQSSTNSSSTAPSTEPVSPPEADEPQQAPEPVQIITSKRSPGKVRKFFSFLGLLIVLAAVGGGVWYWQQTQIKDLNTEKSGLQSEVSSLQSKIAAGGKAAKDDAKTTETATAPAAVRTDIVTGSTTTNTTDATGVSVYYLPGTATEVWVEYGTSPDKLTSSAKRVKGTGEGSAAVYVDQGFNLTELQDGTRYFYRAAGTVDGKTVYGGVAGFQAAK